ncbi:type II toxin-antitoxin system HicB family antitoxin [Rubrivivax gelatinosus]|uniref:Putative RNase H-like HicB family nuclease n=1 Tax=Rubrivivax gelatinosus TaxID=28068 RepID=A0A4R2MGV9_RUBGE|nr:type II toxin-antitoxin system HicB family antitoxin [Rubrivivax gelatinosus]MBK1686216.1 hypothetical protein [Rubrivivax gelatinosus]TCP05711.1 putative RNase H-like HicB family nuclease [Rubrivivax gelatinosus]
MKYPIAIEPEKPGTTWRVTVPDLPGCSAVGAGVDDAIRAASAAIARWIDAAVAEGRDIPLPRPIDMHRQGERFASAIWALADVDQNVLEDRVERVNISLPSRVLRRVDEAAHHARETRSGWLLRVAVEAISRGRHAGGG